MINYLIIIDLLITYLFYFSTEQYPRHFLRKEADIWTGQWPSDLAINGIFDLINNYQLMIHFSMNDLIFKKSQIRMKQWWFWYAIWQLIEKSIILRLFILIMQLINESINYCTLLHPKSIHLKCCMVSIICPHLPQKYICTHKLSLICTYLPQKYICTNKLSIICTYLPQKYICTHKPSIICSHKPQKYICTYKLSIICTYLPQKYI